MTQPVPRSGSLTPVVRSGGSLAGRGPREPDYQPTDELGLARLPEEVLDELETAGLIAEHRFMEWAGDMVTKRRRDGSHYQLVDAWWATLSQLTVVSVRRELEPADGGRLRPKGSWTTAGNRYELPTGLVAERSVWRFQSPVGEGAATPVGKTDDPLDLLPGPLTAPMTGGEVHASLCWSNRWAREQVIAHRLVDGRVRMLVATRESTSRRKLAATDWTAETLDAPVLATTPITLSRMPAVRRGAPGELGKRHHAD